MGPGKLKKKEGAASKHQILIPFFPSRGYILEIYGQHHFELPDLGPIGK